MILGIGTDIVSLMRLRDISKTHGTRFISRVLTAAESAVLPEKNSDIYLAGRFSAKEAVIKALGSRDIHLTDIEILNDESGRPYVSNTDELLKKSGIDAARIHVSISHEKDYAVGMAILEKD